MSITTSCATGWISSLSLHSKQTTRWWWGTINRIYFYYALFVSQTPGTSVDTWPGGLTQEETNKCRSIPVAVLEIGGFRKNLFINRRRSQMQTQTSLPTRFIVTERGTFLHIQSTSSPSGALGKIISFFAISPLPHRPRRIPNGSRSRGFIDQIVLRNGQFLGRRSKHLTEWL